MHDDIYDTRKNVDSGHTFDDSRLVLFVAITKKSEV